MEITRLDSISLKEEFLLKFWESYILENLAENYKCHVAIFERKSKRKVIGTDGFRITKCELDHLVEGVTYPDLVYRNGVTVGGRQYKVQLADGKHGIYARDLGKSKEGEHVEYGCTVCKTKSYIIISVNDGNAKSSDCNEELMKIGDYLFRAGI